MQCNERLEKAIVNAKSFLGDQTEPAEMRYVGKAFRRREEEMKRFREVKMILQDRFGSVL